MHLGRKDASDLRTIGPEHHEPAKAPFRATFFPPPMRVERRADGTLRRRAVTELAPSLQPAGAAVGVGSPRSGPSLHGRTRGKGWPVGRVLFGQFKHAADAVTQWLVNQRLPAGRSLLILSGNSIAHAS
jgi:feruloyl-CoA synthase